jgi:hypothetical protein
MAWKPQHASATTSFKIISKITWNTITASPDGTLGVVDEAIRKLTEEGCVMGGRARTTATAGPSAPLRSAQDDGICSGCYKSKGKSGSFALLRMTKKACGIGVGNDRSWSFPQGVRFFLNPIAICDMFICEPNYCRLQ